MAMNHLPDIPPDPALRGGALVRARGPACARCAGPRRKGARDQGPPLLPLPRRRSAPRRQWLGSSLMIGLLLAGAAALAADAMSEAVHPIPAEAAPWFAAAHTWRLGDWSSDCGKAPDHLWLAFHGDIAKYYRTETAADRRALDERLRARRECALLVYPIAVAKDWGGARSMPQSLSLGRATFALYESLAGAYGNPAWAVQTFTFSGAGRVDLALHRFLLGRPTADGPDQDVAGLARRFVRERLAAMHAGDAMVSKSMEGPLDIPDSWVRFLEAHPHVRASFVYDESAEYPYMFGLAVGIGKAFDPAFDLRSGERGSVAGGRVRFWGAPSHRAAWIGQFARVFLPEGRGGDQTREAVPD